LIDIINGPTKEELLKAFVDRQEITFNLVNGAMKRDAINRLEYEDGSGYCFGFVTKSGICGFYNALKGQGIINIPE